MDVTTLHQTVNLERWLLTAVGISIEYTIGGIHTTESGSARQCTNNMRIKLITLKSRRFTVAVGGKPSSKSGDFAQRSLSMRLKLIPWKVGSSQLQLAVSGKR